MAHFAQIDENNIVTRVIVADQEFIDSGFVGDPSTWKKASYNTRGGVHYNNETGEPDGGQALRANYPGPGYVYDKINDVFYESQPFPSWSINPPTWLWQPPKPMPSTDNNMYRWAWDEATLDWIQY